VSKNININGREIGPGNKVYIIAEMSANHNQDFDQAVKILEAAKGVGADAIKIQTYTPETMTIDCDNDYFKIKGTIWEGKNLFQLYGEAYTPWEWQPKLQKVATNLGLDFFSSPFDFTAVDFLEKMNVPFYKIASFEIVDIPLIKKISATGKPIILSTGMSTLAEIDEAVTTIRNEKNNEIALLKCTSAYPALPEEMNLNTIPHLSRAFDVPVGLSDHTMTVAAPVAAVAVGACIIEKHFTLSRSVPGPDSKFSLEPSEFKQMVEAVRATEKAMGTVSYAVTKNQEQSKIFRRSLFVVSDMEKGEKFTPENLRSIRPGLGIHTRYLEDFLGKKASQKIEKGTPLKFELLGD